MTQITKLLLALLFMTSTVWTVGCGSEKEPAATDSDGTDGPAMPPPQQPGTSDSESGN
jgi:hypothetical protein